MYSVSNAFKEKMRSPIQEHRVTGTIGSLSFSEANIVEGSFSISNQSTDTNDVVLGSCYVGQLICEFTGVNIEWGKWINKTITPTFALNLGNNTWESVPLGIYKIKEAKHTDHGVQVTAYDNMIKFDKKFKKSHFMNLSGMTNIIDQLCTDAGVVCGMSHAQIEALPNGDRTGINIYGSKGKKEEFANDITTLRDLLFWVAQTLGCFATINRAGQLEFRPYTQTVVDTISNVHRIEGATFADYITHYIGVYFENLDDNTEDYYGYDSAALLEEIHETQDEIDADVARIYDLEAALIEWKQKLDNHECTQQEYDEAVAEINAELKPLNKELKQLTKRITWLHNAYDNFGDDGSDMVLGANPLTMAANLTTRDSQRREILGALGDISYTPFQASVLCGCIYDLGDVIQFSGGLYNSDTDSFGCVMSYTYTHNGGTELEGFGVDPSVVVVRNKTQKSTDRANKNAVDATKNQVGTNDPTGGKDGDLHIKYEDNKASIFSSGNGLTIESQSGDRETGYNVTGLITDDTKPETLYAVFDGLKIGNTYTISFDMQLTTSNWLAHYDNQDGFSMSVTDEYWADNAWKGIPIGSGHGGEVTELEEGFAISFYYDLNKHSYSHTFVATSEKVYVCCSFTYLQSTFTGIYDLREVFTDLKLAGGTGDANEPKIDKVYADGDWRNIAYVQKATPVQTTGTLIAKLKNNDGSETEININTMSGATLGAAGTEGLVPAPESGDNEKFLRGDGTWQEVQGGGNDVGLSVVNGAIDSTYDDNGTDVTEDILKDSTGDEIVAVLESIADEIQLLGQPEVYAPIVYSAEEREVGVYTDGKPLYEKTVYLTFTQNTGSVSKTYAHNISNVQTIWVHDAISNVNNPRPAAGNQAAIAVTVNDTHIYVETGQDRHTVSANIVLRYTKTTDVAGSGHYAALGVPAVHYSTSEQVVGTWIDGKTLYQKTVSTSFTTSGGQINSGISDSINVVKFDAIAVVQNSVNLQNGYYTSNSDRFLAYFSTNGNKIHVYSSAYYGTIIANIQYTKTS